MYAWITLVTAGVLEVVWAIALKRSEGFSRLPASIVFLIAATLSFVLLAQALKALPVGTGYAVWTGIGAFGALAVGVLWMGDPISPLRALFGTMLLVGIIGIAFTSSGA